MALNEIRQVVEFIVNTPVLLSVVVSAPSLEPSPAAVDEIVAVLWIPFDQ
jgi:hypothetical protein